MRIKITKEEDLHNKYTPVKYYAYTKNWWSGWKLLCWETSLDRVEKTVDLKLGLQTNILEMSLKEWKKR